jgi:hypothetical protein
VTAPVAAAGLNAPLRPAANRAALAVPTLPTVMCTARELAELIADTTGVGLFLLACVLGAAADTAQHLSDALLSDGERP